MTDERNEKHEASTRAATSKRMKDAYLEAWSAAEDMRLALLDRSGLQFERAAEGSRRLTAAIALVNFAGSREAALAVEDLSDAARGRDQERLRAARRAFLDIARGDFGLPPLREEVDP